MEACAETARKVIEALRADDNMTVVLWVIPFYAITDEEVTTCPPHPHMRTWLTGWVPHV